MCSKGPSIGIVPHKSLFDTSLREKKDMLISKTMESIVWIKRASKTELTRL